MIHLIKNVFTNKQRRKLLKDCQPLIVDMGPQFPGRQTYAELHLHPDFTSSMNDILGIVYKEIGLSLVISKSWANWTNGNKKDIAWHIHPSQYSLVYYMKTFPFFSNGTLFEEPMGFVKAPQNSILVFPAKLRHTAPPSPFPFRFGRYTMAMDLNIVDWQAYG